MDIHSVWEILLRYGGHCQARAKDLVHQEKHLGILSGLIQCRMERDNNIQACNQDAK